MHIAKALMLSAVAVLATQGGAIGQTPAPPVPVAGRPAPPAAQEFTRAPAITDVQLSPDGRHMLAMTSDDGLRVIVSVWDTEHLDRRPTNIGSTQMRFLAARFVKNDRIVVDASQPFTYGGVFNGHIVKEYITDLSGSRFDEILPPPQNMSEAMRVAVATANSQIIDDLPQDPDNVLVEDGRPATRGDIWRVNVHTRDAARIDHASDTYTGPVTDLTGAVRARSRVDFDSGRAFFAQYIRNAAGRFDEHFRYYADDRNPVGVIGFTTDPNVAYISDSRGRDRAAIFEYDINSRRVLERAFEHRVFEAGGVIQSSAPTDYGRVLGFSYNAWSRQVYWIDERLAQLQSTVNRALGARTEPYEWTDIASGQRTRVPMPVDFEVRIADWSDDLQTFVIERSGPSRPPEYFLLRAADGRLQPIGRAYPGINTAGLGRTRLIQYPARDGLMIPAFLTTPDPAVWGPGPYPTLIEPHGGPWARDEWDWDVTGWTQYFASRGFAVLQPQFRGSEGWSQRLWHAGDREWGRKMQDDKDDGVRWMIAQHIADPNRVAMFGYSYGGYAALAAAVRPNGLYQCAISGGGAGDLAALRRQTNDDQVLRQFQGQTVDGLDALAYAGEASIPVFLYHGTRDTTVDIEQSRLFAARLRSANRPVRVLEIPEMGHQIVFWGPRDGATQLTAVEAFLREACGPEGI